MEDVPGYRRMFHGYSDQVEADVVVNMLGGKEAREFPGDRSDEMERVAQDLRQNALTQIDPVTKWRRVFWLVGEKGTPGEGNSLFYLIPAGGLQQLRANWRVPSCQGAPDMSGRETYDCTFVVIGMTFDFSLRQENLGTVDSIRDYVLTRLNKWRS